VSSISRPSRRVIRRRRQAALGAGALLVLLLAISLVSGGGVPQLPAPGLAGPGAAGSSVVYGYAPSRSAAYVARATAGNAQLLYAKSPGGVFATAARVARYRSAIDAAVSGTSIPPNLLEGLVFLESAGRAQVIAGTDVADAVGLTQILAGTGNQLLGMHIKLRASARLTRRIATELARGQTALANRDQRRRAAIDPRFNPVPELEATVRYLQIAERDLGGRLDLAVSAYHAGIGNMQQVLGDYGGGDGVSYTRLFFDSSPRNRAAAYFLLYSLGDDSSQYYWKVLAAERIMSLYRTDRASLRRLNALETAYPSDAEVLVAPGPATSFSGPQGLRSAYAARAIIPLPRNAPALHLAYAPSIGALARKLGEPAALYRGLRPSALRVLESIAAEVHAVAPASKPLIVTGAVIDHRYESLLGVSDPPAETGYTFSIERRYAGAAEAAAFQFVLDRLQSLDLIGWIRQPTTIEITAAPDAGRVLAHGV
jgi:hypothetical protein